MKFPYGFVPLNPEIWEQDSDKNNSFFVRKSVFYLEKYWAHIYAPNSFDVFNPPKMATIHVILVGSEFVNGPQELYEIILHLGGMKPLWAPRWAQEVGPLSNANWHR